MNKWIPSRKYLAGGFAGVVAFFIATATGIDEETATAIAGGLGALVGYLAPPTVAEILRRYEDTLKKIGE